MANQEHFDILKQGVDEWNKWRKEYPNIRPDLSEANLTGRKLIGINFSRTNLRKANLQGVDASHSSFFMAKAVRANFRDTSLWGAGLNETDFHGANLECAYLKHTLLRNANFAEASMIYANLQSARIMNANLTGADVSQAIFDESTVLPDAIFLRIEDNQAIFNKYWYPKTNMRRYTAPDYEYFWQPAWVNKCEWVKQNYADN